MRSILLVFFAVGIALVLLLLMMFVDFPAQNQNQPPAPEPAPAEPTPSEPILPEIQQPESTGVSLLETLSLNPNVAAFETAIATTDLADRLADGTAYTVFVPPNQAVQGAVETSTEAELRDILAAHIVAGEYNSNELQNGQTLTSIIGTPITITISEIGGAANGVPVTATDLYTESGYIHFVAEMLPVRTP